MLWANRVTGFVGFAVVVSAALTIAVGDAAGQDDAAETEEADSASDAEPSDDDSDLGDAGDRSDAGEKADKKKADKKKAGKKKAGKKKGESDVKLSGRLFVRNTSSKLKASGAQWKNTFEVSSARVNVDVRKYGWLRGSIEAELSDNDLDLKDVYLRARVYPGVSVQVGHFKRPISPIALESIWELPVIERGVLASRVQTANYLVPLNLGGRSEGLMVTYESKDSVRPRFDVGVFNARLPRRVSSGADIADQADNLLRDVYLRSQIEPIDGFKVGGTLVAFTQARFADDLRTRFLGSLDVTLDTKHFRAWLEGFAGRTPFFDGTESVGGFLALRVLLAGRVHAPTPWLRLVEPYVIFSALDPSDEKQDNQTTEAGAGITSYFRKNLRLQLEYSRNFNETGFPQDNFAILDSHVVRLQFGARFR